MEVEKALRIIERHCREEIAGFKGYDPAFKTLKLEGAKHEARGCVSTYEEIRTLCRKIRKQDKI